MKYFRWSHLEIMEMSWENYNMYLCSIPRTDIDEKEELEEVELFNLHD